jgi:nucleoside-diphosphate-sugar epimerase
VAAPITLQRAPLQEDVPPDRAPLRLVTLCPTQTLGPLLQPSVNTSCATVLQYLDGSVAAAPAKAKCFVDVRDVALAHVLALENPAAEGRYLLIGQSIPFRTFADLLRRVMPGARVPVAVEPGPPSYPQVRAP